MLVPLGLLHAWVLAEIGIAIADVLFLAEMWRARNFAWARKPWIIAALIWWLWLTICSTPLFFFPTAGWLMSFCEAAVVLRLIIFTAALESWLLTTQNAKNLAWALLAVSALWIGVESWQEYLTGANIFGDHRWGDGSLTGPFYKPRAGQLYAHLLFLAVLPPAMGLMARPGILRRVAGLGLIALGVVTSVLIGQRMGTMFTAIGLATAALFIPLWPSPRWPCWSCSSLRSSRPPRTPSWSAKPRKTSTISRSARMGSFIPAPPSWDCNRPSMAGAITAFARFARFRCSTRACPPSASPRPASLCSPATCIRIISTCKPSPMPAIPALSCLP
jgi:hypothetical protein